MQMRAQRQQMEYQRYQQQQAYQQQREQEAIAVAQQENTKKFLDAHPDIVFRSEEYNQIADLIEIGYDEEQAYQKVKNRRK